MASDPERQSNNQPAENSPRLPFLDAEQQEQFKKDFTLDNFRIAGLPTGNPYLVITLPEESQPLVTVLHSNTRRVALNSLRPFGKLADSGLSEEEEIQIRQSLSDRYEDTLMSLSQSYFELAMSHLTYIAIDAVYLKGLRAAASITNPSRRNSALGEFVEREREIDRLLFGIRHEQSVKRSSRDDIRYVVYSGDQVIYKTPKDLEIS